MDIETDLFVEKLDEVADIFIFKGDLLQEIHHYGDRVQPLLGVRSVSRHAPGDDLHATSSGLAGDLIGCVLPVSLHLALDGRIIPSDHRRTGIRHHIVGPAALDALQHIPLLRSFFELLHQVEDQDPHLRLDQRKVRIRRETEIRLPGFLEIFIDTVPFADFLIQPEDQPDPLIELDPAFLHCPHGIHRSHRRSLVVIGAPAVHPSVFDGPA